MLIYPFNTKCRWDLSHASWRQMMSGLLIVLMMNPSNSWPFDIKRLAFCFKMIIQPYSPLFHLPIMFHMLTFHTLHPKVLLWSFHYNVIFLSFVFYMVCAVDHICCKQQDLVNFDFFSILYHLLLDQGSQLVELWLFLLFFCPCPFFKSSV